jgi:hypothetical protein
MKLAIRLEFIIVHELSGGESSRKCHYVRNDQDPHRGRHGWLCHVSASARRFWVGHLGIGFKRLMGQTIDMNRTEWEVRSTDRE